MWTVRPLRAGSAARGSRIHLDVAFRFLSLYKNLAKCKENWARQCCRLSRGTHCVCLCARAHDSQIAWFDFGPLSKCLQDRNGHCDWQGDENPDQAAAEEAGQRQGEPFCRRGAGRAARTAAPLFTNSQRRGPWGGEAVVVLHC